MQLQASVDYLIRCLLSGCYSLTFIAIKTIDNHALHEKMITAILISLSLFVANQVHYVKRWKLSDTM